MRYRLLGPLAIGDQSDPVALRGQRQAKLIAALLLQPGAVVPVGTLVEVLWDEHAPAQAVKVVRNCVSLLRTVLARAGDPAELRTTDAGYRLVIPPGELDVAVFQDGVARAERLAAAGRRAEAAGGRRAEAIAALREALDLWRGPALYGLGCRALAPVAAHLDEQHLLAWERYADLLLDAGRDQEVIGPLAELAAAQPLRERLVARLMLALYRAGRQADALARYHALRVRLREELGIDPDPALADMYRRILRADPALRRGDPAPGPVPRQLPAAINQFAGRGQELAVLDGLLDGEGGERIAVVHGCGGVGKTTLAVYWAQRMADRFPDGQLYVDLRGFHPTGPVMAPAEAVREFLDALDVPPERIPSGLAAQVARYRSLVAGRRMLVVLDNARDAEQVRPLLPGSPEARVLITSRAQLTSLVVAEGATPVALGLLPALDARAVLGRRLSAGRLAAEPAAVDRIITACGGLPLALAIVAARAHQTGFPLDTLAAELGRTDRYLDALDTGDDTTTVATVFSWSYAALTPAAARMFRLLGLHPGPDLSVAAAASLAAVPRVEVHRSLRELVQASLLTEGATGRYRLHDLLRVYAIERAHAHDPEADRDAAQDRVIDHYLYTGYAADRLLNPRREALPQTPPARVEPEPLDGPGGAMAWFTSEHQVLLGVLDHAVRHQRLRSAWQLGWSLETYMYRRSHWRDLAVAWGLALQAGEGLADPHAQAVAHRGVGHALVLVDDLPGADHHFAQALELYERAGDPVGVAHTYRLMTVQREPEVAVGYAREAVLRFRAAGHRKGEALALNSLGWYHALLGDYHAALSHCGRALALNRELGNREGEGAAWDSLGYAHHHLGHHSEAVNCYERALALRRALHDAYAEASTLTRLGDVRLAAGEREAARALWRHALAILTDLRHPYAEEVAGRLAEVDRSSPDFGIAAGVR